MTQSNVPPRTGGKVPEAQSSRIVITLGRGDKGKSFLLRTVAERALVMGLQVVIADADPGNRTLAHVFQKRGVTVFEPRDLSHVERDRFIGRVAQAAERERGLYLLDVGGNDQSVVAFGGGSAPAPVPGDPWGLDLVDPFGNVPVTIAFLLGGDPFDLPLLQTVLDSSLARRNLLLVHNEGTRRTVLTETAPWEPTTSSKIYQKAIAAGARSISFPNLDPVIAYRLTKSGAPFKEAIGGTAKGAEFSAQERLRLQLFLRAFDKSISDADIGSWLA
jgi:hypothetical protein